MLRSLSWLRRPRRPDPAQLALAIEHAPRDAAALLERLRGYGLQRLDRMRLTHNRTVMVSFSGRELRVHRGYLAAPEAVLRAIVTFACGRTKAERRQARRVILAFRPAEEHGAPRRAPATAPEDAALAARLADWHARYNAAHFGGRLRPVIVRVSRRMRSRLGHYTAATHAGESAEIAISRAHVRRHGWEEALHTLLHEMVHQWQDERGHPIDHGAGFRARARELGITPSARRTVLPVGRGRAAAAEAIGLRAARKD